MRPAALALALALAPCAVGCRRAPQVGDHVLVEWKGTTSPAVIIAIEGPAKFRVHYDGLADDYDETIVGTRIQGRVTGGASSPAAPVRSARGAASAAPPSVFKAGDHVKVEWQGTPYAATIVAVLGAERYRVHYEGFGPEWDEDVGLGRLTRR